MRHATQVLAAACALAASLLIGAAASADSRLALLIANQNYPASVGALDRPHEDARILGEALERVGFTVEIVRDADEDTILEAVLTFTDELARLRRDDDEVVGFFYYAGHGASADVRGAGRRNYIFPAGAEIRSGRELTLRGVRLDEIVDTLSSADATTMIVISDACRDELEWSETRGRDRGWTPEPSRPGMIVVQSTVEGETAPDDGRFAEALARRIPEPGIYVNRAFELAFREVQSGRDGYRLPTITGALSRDFCFAGCSTGGVSPTETSLSANASDALDPVEVAIYDRLSEPCEFRDFAAAYPDSPLAPLARARGRNCGSSTVSRPSTTPPAVTLALPDGRTLSPNDEPPVLAPGQLPDEFEAFRDCATCPQMVALPAGAFLMGSPEGEPGRIAREGPQHRVAIPRAFAVGRFELTVGQYRDFAEAAGLADPESCRIYVDEEWSDGVGSNFRSPGYPQGDDYPAMCISWDEAQAYVVWLSEQTGESYRLLTEAEWEYAARAGSTSRFHFGDDASQLCAYANGADLASSYERRNLACSDDVGARAAQVGSYQPNDFGLFDMLGNAWEWAQDCGGRDDGYRNAPTDGSAVDESTGDCERRMVRGGSFIGQPESLRSAERALNSPNYRGVNVGFRVARDFN